MIFIFLVRSKKDSSTYFFYDTTHHDRTEIRFSVGRREEKNKTQKVEQRFLCRAIYCRGSRLMFEIQINLSQPSEIDRLSTFPYAQHSFKDFYLSKA
jgi:hypothetical protein